MTDLLIINFLIAGFMFGYVVGFLIARAIYRAPTSTNTKGDK